MIQTYKNNIVKNEFIHENNYLYIPHIGIIFNNTLGKI